MTHNAAKRQMEEVSMRPGGPRKAGRRMNVLRKCFADQRFLFLLVGGINTAFSVALFTGLMLTIGRRMPSSVCLGISWTVSLIAVFFAYRRLVFRVKGHFWLDFFRFAGTNITALLINMLALTVFADVIGWPAIPVQLAITCFMVIFNYFGHKHVSFRRN
jgi:putative flippase GtrA